MRCEVDSQYSKDELKQLHFYCQNCGKEMEYNEIRDCVNTLKEKKMNKGNKVKIIGGYNEFGQPTMIGKTGIITSFGAKYYDKVKGVDTQEVFVEFENFGLHCFNDYHLKLI